MCWWWLISKQASHQRINSKQRQQHEQTRSFTPVRCGFNRHSALWKPVGRIVTFSTPSCALAKLQCHLASSFVSSYDVTRSFLSFAVVDVLCSMWKAGTRKKAREKTLDLILSLKWWLCIMRKWDCVAAVVIMWDFSFPSSSSVAYSHSYVFLV